MSQKSLSKWLSLLESRHPTEIELGLDRISRVAKQLGFLPSGDSYTDSFNIQAIHVSPATKVITVAGTNGKGSCVAAIDSILRAAGYRVGTYTSPHFIDYNERININGQPVNDGAICAAFDRIEAARGDISLSYFEFGTLAALLILADSKLDVAILEVGLGGRLDAVNIIDADIAIVTSIALDHQDWLGTDLNTIAAEKAAIGRAGRPLIYGDEKPILGLLDAAKKIGTQLFLNGRDFSLSQFGVVNKTLLPLVSVACSLQAVKLLDSTISELTIENGLSQVQLRGRYQQVLVDDNLIILDVAHNPQASGLLAQRLSLRKDKVIAVVGIMSDKDISGILEPMIPRVKAWYFCDIPDQTRAATAKSMSSILYQKESYNQDLYNNEPYNTEVKASPSDVQCDWTSQRGNVVEQSSPVAAFQAALASANAGDTVLVFGSFFTLGPVLNWLESVG
jgi:dihydrofolate synthase/folylpolyglutamate synthase